MAACKLPLMRRFPACFSVVPLIFLALFARPQSQTKPQTCLAFVTRNLAKGTGNWYTYFKISDAQIPIKKGDQLVYTILLDPENPEPKGSIDFGFTDGSEEFRDLKIVDQNGVRGHGDGAIKGAMGQWLTRKFPLDLAAGKTATNFTVCEEADTFGRYVVFVKDIRITHADGTSTPVYSGGVLDAHELVLHNGYTEYPTCVQVDLNLVDTDLKAAIAKADKLGVQAAKVGKIEQDLSFARKFLEAHPNPELKVHLDEADQKLRKLQSEEVTDEYLEEVLHTAQHALSHAHPEMAKYTGHLVGHAHIDLQWLWEWQEGMVATQDTFVQAAKFMDEFPGFTFSQSSSCLYETVLDTWPDVFKTIQAKVKKGQWEIVGGRVCEGDTNMISPESHIRQFLYGQEFFRENFGKTATVGWEPDTFGHTIQMPQILKLGGCDSYYFCRGGKGKPLFWWQGLDGTKILSFDEPATGSWYNSDLSYKQFEEMLDFEKSTSGAKDSLMVYGIGNHGGGPSREYIETALGWMKDKTKPKVKFSTATQFFNALRKYDLTKIPVIDQELNPVFDGCYTSHSEIKQLNRQSEYATTSAESVSTVASLFGFKYPRESFRRSWEDICFEHHHDTLPGSGIHAPYERTKVKLQRVIADDKDISMRALESLSVKVTPEKGGFSVMVFNPSGWTRSGMVRHWIGGTGWEGDGVVPSRCVATDPDGVTVPVTEVDPIGHLSEFWVTDVPAMGWKVYHLTNRKAGAIQRTHEERIADNRLILPDEKRLIGENLTVEFDDIKGSIKSIVSNANPALSNHYTTGIGVPELHVEHDDGMSAWVLGKILSVKTCTVTGIERFAGRSVGYTYRIPWEGLKTGESTLKQTFRLEGDKIIVDVDCDWNAVGTGGKEAPLLRVAFDTGLKDAKATYEVPFGALTRPIDGKECVGLNWADVSDGDNGIAVLNDSKSGYSSTTTTIGNRQSTVLRMSLIRSSTGPDPNPNPGRHHWRYAIVPHKGDWRAASLPRLGQEFQSPFMSATVPFDAHGPLPKQWSLLNASDPSVLVTGIKRAENSDDLIVHLFDAGGQGSKGTLSVNTPVAQVWNVNFLEDELGELRVKDNSVPLDLHKFQIQCLKLRTASQK